MTSTPGFVRDWDAFQKALFGRDKHMTHLRAHVHKNI